MSCIAAAQPGDLINLWSRLNGVNSEQTWDTWRLDALATVGGVSVC